MRPYRGTVALAVIAATVASALDGFSFTLLIPLLRLLFGGATAAGTPTGIERLHERVGVHALDGLSQEAALAVVVGLIVLVFALKNVAAYAAGYLATATQERVVRDLRGALFDHLLRLDLPYFQRERAGHLMARALSDADQTRHALGAALVGLVRNGAAVVIYVVILLLLSWRLALMTLVLAPLLAITLRPMLRAVRARVRAATAVRGDMAAAFHETIRGIRVVKAHVAEARERRRLRDAAAAHTDSVLRAQRLAILASPLSEVLGAVVFAALLLVGARATGAEALRPEVFLTFVALTLRLLSPVKALSQFPTLAAEAAAGADRIFEVLDRPAVEIDSPNARRFDGRHEEIVFRDVWVAYEENRWALQGIDLTVRRGEVLALVGPSGAGKSTLVDLLPRFVEPRRGEVTIDGVALSDFSRSSLRQAIGFVAQETVVFHDTVRANIAFGFPEADRAAVEAAARAAHAHDFITALPNGYDTVIGERGLRLSGGERQRLAIARALLHDPAILVLDEATSALDSESERLVREAIALLMDGRTVFVIAHRLSTVRHADRIVVLRGGRIVDAGSYDAVCARGGWDGAVWEETPASPSPVLETRAPR